LKKFRFKEKENRNYHQCKCEKIYDGVTGIIYNFIKSNKRKKAYSAKKIVNFIGNLLLKLMNIMKMN